jgi:hypothetical protein
VLATENAGGPVSYLRAYGGSGYDRRAGDAYYTERALVNAALLHLPDLAGRRILEPASGKGAIVRVLEEHGHQVIASDIARRCYGRPGVDFLKLRSARRARAIFTNPPYKRLAPLFVRHALALMQPVGGLVAMLLRVNWDAEPGRLDLFRGPPFRAKITCCWRPHWTDDRVNDPFWTFAWYVWDWLWSGPSLAIYVGEDEACQLAALGGGIA